MQNKAEKTNKLTYYVKAIENETIAVESEMDFSMIGESVEKEGIVYKVDYVELGSFVRVVYCL